MSVEWQSIQRDNAACVLGTLAIDSDVNKFFVAQYSFNVLFLYAYFCKHIILCFY